MSRIAYLSDSLIPSQRANSVHVMHMCNAFQELGHHVTLFGLGKKNQDLDQVRSWYGVNGFTLDLTTTRIPKLTLYWHAQRMLSKIKKQKPDFVFGRSLYGCALVANKGYDVIYETHDPVRVMSEKQKRAFFKLLESGNLKGLVVLSDALKTILIDEVPKLSPERILVAHDGATIRDYDLSELASYKWPITSEDRLQVGYLGTISQGRGIEMVVSLAKENPHLDFHIVGGYKEDLTHLNIALESISENLFFHGFVSPREAALARKKCDILLAPYQNNVTIRSGKNTAEYMSPLKIFEYMEAEKPIICSDLKVLREVLENDKNCILVSASRKEEWQEALDRLVNDSKLRANLAHGAKEDLVTKYSWKHRAQTILKFNELRNI